MLAKLKSLPPLPAEDLNQILNQTRVLWEEARGKSFFITGGTGFFGTWLLESFAHINDLLNLGARAVIVSRDPTAFARKAPHLAHRSDLAFIEGDVRTFPLPAGNHDYIIHAATDVRAGTQSHPDEVFSAITGGTRRILDLAAQAGVRKLLIVSSGAIYGPQPPELTHIPETYLGAPDPLLASSAYGEGKRVSEYLAAAHARRYGYEVKIARCFAFVGPLLPLDSVFAIGNFIRDSLARQPIRILGDGSPMRSYLYASDLAVALWTLLFKAPSHRAYNIGSAEDLNIMQLAKLVRETLDNPAPIGVSGENIPASPLSRYVPSVSRAQEELGLHLTVPLDQAILKTARWATTAADCQTSSFITP